MRSGLGSWSRKNRPQGESAHPVGGVLWIEMSNEPRNNRHSVYKRLETDAEFRKRLRNEHKCDVSTLVTSAELDDIAWDQVKVQRRIVEDVS